MKRYQYKEFVVDIRAKRLIFMIDPLFDLAVIFLGEMWLQGWLGFKG